MAFNFLELLSVASVALQDVMALVAIGFVCELIVTGYNLIDLVVTELLGSGSD